MHFNEYKVNQDNVDDLKADSLTLTANPLLGITRPLGILQVSSFNRTWALQFTPPMVIMIFIHELTVFSLLCCCYIWEKEKNAQILIIVLCKYCD